MSFLHPVRSTAKNLNPATAHREHEKATPHRAGIATLPDQESALESETHRAAKLTQITARIGGPGHPRIRNASHGKRQGPRPQIGAASAMKPADKRKSHSRPPAPSRKQTASLGLSRFRTTPYAAFRTQPARTPLGGRISVASKLPTLLPREQRHTTLWLQQFVSTTDIVDLPSI